MTNPKAVQFREAINDIKNYKECIPKQYEAYVCAPPVGTLILNKLRYPSEYRRCTNREYYLPDELAQLKTRDADFYNHLCKAAQAGFYEEVTTSTIVVCGVLGELYTIPISAFEKNWTFTTESKTELENLDKILGTRSAGSEAVFDWKRVRCTNDLYKKPTLMAYFCNAESTPAGEAVVATAVHPIRPPVVINEVGVSHGKGDFLIIDRNAVRDVNNPLATGLVGLVNGNVFALTYNNAGWSGCLPDMAVLTTCVSKPKFSLLKSAKSGAKPRKASEINNSLSIFFNGLCHLYVIRNDIVWKNFLDSVNINVLLAFTERIKSAAKKSGNAPKNMSFFTFENLQLERRKLTTSLVDSLRKHTPKPTYPLLPGFWSSGTETYATAYESDNQTVTLITKVLMTDPHGKSVSIIFYDEMNISGNARAYAVIEIESGKSKPITMRLNLQNMLATASLSEADANKKYAPWREADLHKLESALLETQKEMYGDSEADRVEELPHDLQMRLVSKMTHVVDRIHLNSTCTVLGGEWQNLLMSGCGTRSLDKYAKDGIATLNKLYGVINSQQGYAITVLIVYYEALISALNKISKKLLDEGISQKTAAEFRVRNFTIDFNAILSPNNKPHVFTMKHNKPSVGLSFVLDIDKAIKQIQTYSADSKSNLGSATTFSYPSATEAGVTSTKTLSYIDFLKIFAAHIEQPDSFEEVIAPLVDKEVKAIYPIIFEMAKRKERGGRNGGTDKHMAKA